MYGQQYAGQLPYIDFNAKLRFNLEWKKESMPGGWVGEQKIVEESISITDFVGKLQIFLNQSEFRELLAIDVDGNEIYRREPNQEIVNMEASAQDGFAELKKREANSRSLSVVAASQMGFFRQVLSVSFVSAHPASTFSVECSLNAAPKIYFRRNSETQSNAEARIKRFNLIMQNVYERSSFVIQERDLLIPIVQNLASRFSTIFAAKSGLVQLYEGNGRAPIWRESLSPRV